MAIPAVNLGFEGGQSRKFWLKENIGVVLNQLFHWVSRQACSQYFRKTCIKEIGEYEKSPIFLTPGRHLFYEGNIGSCVSP